MVEMEIETHLGQRALYKIPMWATSPQEARRIGANHANQMQSEVVKVKNIQFYRLPDDAENVLPGLYPMEQRHHLGREEVAPFDSVKDLPSFKRSLKQDYWRGGKYTRPIQRSTFPRDQGYLYAHPADVEEVETDCLFDSIESDHKSDNDSNAGLGPRPLWKRLLCCFSCSKTPTPKHHRLRSDSW